MNTETEFHPLDTNEDGEVSPMEELIGLANELETLQTADFNFWRAARLARLRTLIESGVEGDDFVFQPEPPAVDVTEFDAEGFSTDMTNGCVAYKGIIDIANRWAESKDRLLEYAASFMKRNRYMLPIDRLQTDAEFQGRYAKNLDTAKNGFTFGRSGYKNQPVFESFVAQDYRGRTYYVGQGVIEDHYFPYAGALQGDIVATFKQDIDSGAARERFLLFAANALAEMDRDNMDKWEGYRPVPQSLQWNRIAELELARANPNY